MKKLTIVEKKKEQDKLLLEKLDQLETARKTKQEKVAYTFGFMEGWQSAIEFLEARDKPTKEELRQRVDDNFFEEEYD